MFEKLKEIERNYIQNEALLCDGAVLSDPNRLREITKKQKTVEEIVEQYRAWKEWKARESCQGH